MHPESLSDTLHPAVLRFLRQIGDSALHSPLPDLGYASSVLVPLLGCPRRAVARLLVAGLSEPATLKVLQQALQAQDRGSSAPFILPLRTQSGDRAEVLVCPRPLALPDGTQILTATLSPAPPDLARQQAVQEERDRLLSLLDRLPAFVALVAPDHSIRYANEAFREQFGLPQGSPCYACMKQLSSPCDTCPPFDVFDSGSLSIYEWTSAPLQKAFRIYSYPFPDDDGSPLVLKLGMDITQSKQVQEALAMSEERYRSITDNLYVGIAVLDRELRLVAANPLFTRWFGATGASALPGTPGTMQLSPLFCALKPADSDEHASHAPDVAQGPLNMARITFENGMVREQEFVCQNQEIEHIFRTTACPIRNLTGGVSSVILLLEDITERKRVTERLNRARQLEAMGTLAAGIAHEINQPLSALRLYTSGLEMLVEQQHPIPRQTLLERLGRILHEADNIQEIIAHMRSLVMQREASPTDRADLNSAVTRSLGLVGAQLEAHGIRLVLALDATLPCARANLVQLEQVVINLVINAMHALDTVNAPESCGKWIHITTRQSAGDTIQLVVADNGPGLQGLESRIFDPFFTTKEAGTGMGLGLSIVHTFVEAWHGHITAASSGPALPAPQTDTEMMRETGATFTITLPAAAASSDTIICGTGAPDHTDDTGEDSGEPDAHHDS